MESEPLLNHVVVTLPSFSLCVSCSYCEGVRMHQGFEQWAAQRHIHTRTAILQKHQNRDIEHIDRLRPRCEKDICGESHFQAATQWEEKKKETRRNFLLSCTLCC